MPTASSVIGRSLLTPALCTGLLCAGLLGCETTQNEGDQAGTGGGNPAAVTPATGAGDRTETGGITIVHADWREIGYRWDWTGFPSLTASEHVSYCDPYDDLLVVQGTGNSLTILDATTGRSRWSDRPSNPLAEFVGAYREGDTLFSCSESEVFIMDINTGNWKDRQAMSQVVNTRPLRYGDTLVFGTPTGELFCHRTDFGVTAWRYDLGGPIDANPIWVNSTIGAVTQDGHVAFLAPGSAAAVSNAHIGGRLRTNPVTDGTTMFVACTDQSVYAFRPESDRHVWRYRTNEELTIQPTYDSGVVYVTVPATGLVALDSNRGSENWIGPDAGGIVVARRGGVLIVWNGEEMKSVEPVNGDVLHSFRVPGIAQVITDHYNDGYLYVVTRDNNVIRFAPR